MKPTARACARGQESEASRAAPSPTVRQHPGSAYVSVSSCVWLQKTGRQRGREEAVREMACAIPHAAKAPAESLCAGAAAAAAHGRNKVAAATRVRSLDAPLTGACTPERARKESHGGKLHESPPPPQPQEVRANVAAGSGHCSPQPPRVWPEN